MTSKEPTDIKINDLKIEDCSDEDNNVDEEMPPLETIEQEMNPKQPEQQQDGDESKIHKKKNIIIPEDKKKDEDDEDDPSIKDGYTDILNNGDLRKKVIKKGDSSIRPQRGSKVIIKLQTRLYTGGVDDQEDCGTGTIIEAETFDRFELNLGDNDLHQGLDLMIPLMELNEICRAIIKPRFAYGSLGNKDIGIPEDATLDCQIELLEIPKQSENMFGEDDEEQADSIANKEALDQRIKIGNYKKLRGNFWFSRSDYSLAIQCYRGALKYLDANQDELKMLDQKKEELKNKSKNSKEDDKKDDKIDEEFLKKVDDLIEKRAQTFNNLAAAQIKLEAYDSAMRSLNDSLLLRPNNPKALFRHAKIQQEKGNLEEAIDDLKKALAIEPNSESIQFELDRLNKILMKQLKDQKELYRRMIQGKQQQQNNMDNKKSKNPKLFNSNNLNDSNDNNDTNQQSKSWYNNIHYWPAALSLGLITICGAIAIQLYSSTTTK